MNNNFEGLRQCITSAIAKTGILPINKKIEQQLEILQNYVGTYYYTSLYNKLFLYLASSENNKPSRYARYDKDKSSLQVYINTIVLHYLINNNKQIKRTIARRTKLNKLFTETPPAIFAKVKINNTYEIRPIEIIIGEVGSVDISNYDCYKAHSPELSTIAKQITDVHTIDEEKLMLQIIYKNISKEEAAKQLNVSISTLYRKFNDFREKITK